MIVQYNTRLVNYPGNFYPSGLRMDWIFYSKKDRS
jgi:hypothetical protein